MRRMAWCALLVLLAGSVTARGQAPGPATPPETGGAWLARCGAVAREGAPPARAGNDAGACLGWIEGLLDINEIYRGLGALEKTSEGFCTPDKATVAQAAAAVARYFDEHPSVLHFSARMLAYMALRHAFPCPGRT